MADCSSDRAQYNDCDAGRAAATQTLWASQCLTVPSLPAEKRADPLRSNRSAFTPKRCCVSSAFSLEWK